MMQQVNLYTEELRPKKEPLQAGSALGLMALALVAMAIGGGVIGYQNAELEDRVAPLAQQTEALQQSVTQLSGQVSARQPDPDVQAAVDRVTNDLARRQRLLERVEKLVVNSGARFSPQMAALARQIPDNVWLTGIRLNAQNQAVTLEGRATTSSLVPTYLENLGSEPVFIGRTFGGFRLSRPEEGRWIEFRVATQPSVEGQ